MTTSMAAGWLFVIAGFTGLVGMQLVLIRGARSPRAACLQRAARESAAAQLQGVDNGPARPIPGPSGPGVGAQRAGGEQTAPTR